VLGYYQAGPGGQKQGSIEEQSVEHGKRVVGAFFRLAPGESTELHLLFQTPTRADGRYRLYVQKQAGIPARPLQLAISHPGGVVTRQAEGTRDEEALVSW
jgi:hypothetical protein